LTRSVPFLSRAGFVTTGLLASVLAVVPPAIAAEPDRGPAPAPPRERVFSMWGAVAGAGASSASVMQSGLSSAGEAADFGAFLMAGVRLEFYPSVANPVSRHFGFAVDLEGFAGESDIETRPGLPAEEVALTGGILTPSFVARLQGRSWEAYAGVGATLLWVTRISNVSGFGSHTEDTDGETPLGLALFAGVRRIYPGKWFFMIEARHTTGKNDFSFDPPATGIELDWRMTGLAAGAGYKF